MPVHLNSSRIKGILVALPLLALILLAAFSWMSTVPLELLGPSDKPRFASFDWVSAEVTYKVKTGANSTTRRKFVIDDPEMLRSGFTLLKPRKISGFSLPAGSQVTLKTRDGSAWNMHPVFEDRIDFGSVEDLSRSYVVETSNQEFFDWLKRECLRDARKTWPEAQLKNIVLRANLSLDSYQPVNP